MSGFSRTSSTSSHYKRSPKGHVNKYFGMYMGYVKDNVDPQNNGRLKVWIPEFGSSPDDKTSWITVGYCAPFAGATPVDKNGKNTKDFNDTQTSYGMWFTAPDLENQVAVMFIDGHLSNGYWLGCLYNEYMNQMVPAIAASTNNPDYPGTAVPVAEYNKKTNEHVSQDNITRPVHQEAFNGIADQGLIKDHVRGVTTSSARRETPSQVFGISTPGPKNEKSQGNRLGGSKFIMDDGAGSEYIGFRTRSGAFLKIDETNGIIYAINKRGTAWLQLDDEGNIDGFAAKSISLRAQEDINLRADRDVIIESGRDFRLKAAKDYTGEERVAAPNGGIEGGNILIEACNKLDMTIYKAVHLNLKSTVDALIGDTTKIDITTDLNVRTDNTIHTSLSDTKFYAQGNLLTTVDGGYDLYVSKDVKQFSGANFNTTGSTSINNQTTDFNILGGSSIKMTAPLIVENGAPASPASMPSTTSKALLPSIAAIIQQNSKKNVLPGFNNKFDRKMETVRTTVRRFMTYEPCNEHLNKGLGGTAVPSFSKYKWYTSPKVGEPTAGATPAPSPEPTFIQGDGDCSQWTFPPEAKAYEEYFRAASAQYGMPLCLLVEQCRQESHFNPNAHNVGSNAQGLMQIVPRWHPTVRNAYDPAEAIPYGTKYMAQNYNKFGSWDKALAAYNWGPGALNSHLKQNDGRLNMATLPAETSHYITVIMSKAKFVQDAPAGTPVVNNQTPPTPVA